jgi:hypothetical protein
MLRNVAMHTQKAHTRPAAACSGKVIALGETFPVDAAKAAQIQVSTLNFCKWRKVTEWKVKAFKADCCTG